MSNVSNIYDFYQQNYDEIDGFVMINFTSDGSVNKRGFRIEYYLGNAFIYIASIDSLKNNRPILFDGTVFILQRIPVESTSRWWLRIQLRETLSLLVIRTIIQTK